MGAMVTELRPNTGGPTHETEGEHDRQRFSILIADDDRGNREALGEMLDSRGFRTVLAADGGEAVELVQVDLVHLILFDMHMPRLTGLEAFAVIRQTLDKLLPAVLMTADASNDLIRQAFAAQVYSVIPKPVSPNVVLHTLERALTKVYGALMRHRAEHPPKPLPPHPPADQRTPPTEPDRRVTDEDRPAE
jgi:two-component system, response regulator PdtaR